MEHQDWITITARKNKKTTEKKLRDTDSPVHQHNRVLAESETVVKPKKVSPESRSELVKARLAKGYTQEQADTACAIPRHTFKGLESGQLTPNQQILSKISRQMRVDIKLV